MKPILRLTVAFIALILGYSPALAADSFGHNAVKLRGGFFNYWSTSYDFTYMGDNVWELNDIVFNPTPNSYNSNRDIEIQVDGSDWKPSVATAIECGKDYTVAPGGNDFSVPDDIIGLTIDIKVTFTGTNEATVRFNAATSQTVYYILDNVEHELSSPVLRIDSDDMPHTLYYKCVNTVGATQTATYYGAPSAITVDSDSYSGTLAEGSTAKYTLAAGQYTYTVTTALPDSRDISITRSEPIPYVRTRLINGEPYADGDYVFTPSQTLAFEAVMSRGANISYGIASDATLADGTFVLVPGGTGTLSAPADADAYIYTLNLTPNADDSQWSLTVSVKADPDVEKRNALSPTLSRAIISQSSTDYQPENPLTLWFNDIPYTQAPIGNYGDNYLKSFPLGNGRLGAAWHGTPNDYIMINDKTHYIGTKDPQYNMSEGIGNYQPLGYIMVSQGGSCSSIIRELNLTNGVSTSVADINGVTVAKELLVSKDQDAIILHYTCYPANELNLSFKIGNPTNTAVSGIYTDGTASYSNKYDSSSPLKYNVTMRVIQSGGTLSYASDGISVSGASEVFVVCAAATDYDINGADFTTGESDAQLAQRVNGIAAATASLLQTAGGWQSVYDAHVREFSSQMNASTLTIDGAVCAETSVLKGAYDGISISADKAASSAQTKMVDMLMYNMGRYLNLSASRGNTSLPSNLQGIWAAANPQWNCDFHANINLQMNYWNAEPTNLSATHMPFLNYIKAMATKRWTGYADKLVAGTGGWTTHLLNNPFGACGQYNGNYVESAAWNCSHIWQHYLYTMDSRFLSDFFPTLWGACKFFFGYLRTDTDGKYIVPNTYSPENGSGTGYAVHAQQLVWELLRNTYDAATILGNVLNATELARLKNYLDNMDDGIHVQGGLLQEWKGVTPNASDTHRHLSHLMSLYPLARITPYDADLTNFNAAYASLRVRGDDDGSENAAWNTAWKMNGYARARQGDLALRQLAIGMPLRISPSLRSMTKNTFQVEGDCGISAAIAEMLVQGVRSNITATDPYAFIDIAPALPSAWASGEITGIKTQGNYEVSYIWRDGTVQEIRITACANSPLPLFVNYNNGATKCLTDELYYVSEISGATRSDLTAAQSAAISDAAHTWRFTPAAKGAYIVITRGQGQTVEPDLPTPSNFIPYTIEPMPNTDGIVDIVDDGTALMHIMFGTDEARYFDGSVFVDGGVKWSVSGTDDVDTDANDLTGYAMAAPYSSGASATPYTECNGAMAATAQGGLFLTPISGAFIRLEPEYNGTATIWLRHDRDLVAMDEMGRPVTTVNGVSDGSADTFSHTLQVKGGKTYFIGAPAGNMGFVAASFVPAEYAPQTYNIATYLDSDDNTGWMSALSANTAANFVLKRSFTAGYVHPIVLPFSVSESKMREIFGTDVTVLYLDPADNSTEDSGRSYTSAIYPAVMDGTLSLTKHFYQMLYANVPAYVVPSVNVADPTFSNVTFEGAQIASYAIDPDKAYIVTGAYKATPASANSDIYYIDNKADGAILLHSVNGVGIKASRSWIKHTGGGTPLQRIKAMQFDTSAPVSLIMDIASDGLPEPDSQVIYNILGIPVATGSTDGLSPGIYLSNGKKLIIR